MGYYPPDLEDMPTSDLIRQQTKILAIIAEREKNVTEGLCPYCKQNIETHTCKYKSQVWVFHTQLRK